MATGFRTDKLSDFAKNGTSIVVSGTIFRNHGNTPSNGIVLYNCHTNMHGNFTPAGGQTGWGTLHGYNRGWIKTGQDGKYTTYTIIPAVYPNRFATAHIHPVFLQPNGKYYWVANYQFKDDSLLTREDTYPASRGSAGFYP